MGDKLFLDYTGLTDYDSKIKSYITAEITTKHADDATTSDVAALSAPQGTNIQELSLDIIDAAAQAFMNATEETAQVVITTEVQGVSVSNLLLNVYYNSSDLLALLVSTDNNGMVAFKVPNGYTYKIVFPDIVGCKPIIPVLHTAAVLQRSIEVEYVPNTYIDSSTEVVTILLQQYVGETVTNLSLKNVTVTADGVTTTYLTDSNGKIIVSIPANVQYTVTAPLIEGLYLHGLFSRTFVANAGTRGIVYYYRSYQSGLFIIDTNGDEYTKEEWETALSNGTVSNENAVLIKVATTTLANNNGVFGVSIDALRERTEPTRQWNPNNAIFNSIPLNGNNTSQPYYYDGKTASELIQNEGDERTLDTPAVDYAMDSARSINGLSSFLGSVGQWAELWANRIEVDDLLVLTRPNGTYLFSTYTTNKWTSTQYNNTSPWYWTYCADYTNVGGKSKTCVVVPFFAI